MNKAEHEDAIYMERRLRERGFADPEIATLRRAAVTLRRWSEEECNGTIQRDETSGRAYRYRELANGEHVQAGTVNDREAGARVTVARIMAGHPDYTAHYQSDPRGPSLYVISRLELRDYTLGVAVW